MKKRFLFGLVAFTLAALAGCGSLFGPDYISSGVEAHRQGDFDTAIAQYTEAIKVDPASIPGYYFRSDAYFVTGNYDKAFADANEAIRLDPDCGFNAYFIRGVINAEKKDYENAIADYNEAIRLRPLAMLYNGRGWTYYLMGDYGKAIADADEAIRLEPDASYYDTRGAAYRGSGDYDRAITDYTKALSLDSELTASYDGRGQAYHRKGDYGKAVTDYEAALKLDPDFAGTAANLALARQGTPLEPVLAQASTGGSTGGTEVVPVSFTNIPVELQISQDEAFKALEGTWEGTYATNIRNGIVDVEFVLNVYELYEGSGFYRATMQHYVLPRAANTLTWSTAMDIHYEKQTGKYTLPLVGILSSNQRLNAMDNFIHINVEGALIENEFNGNAFNAFNTRDKYAFRATRTGGPQTGASGQPTAWTVNNTATWVQAIGGIRSAGNNKAHVINVTGDISIPMSADPTFGSTTGITVALEGSGSISASSVGAMLFVRSGQKVVVKDLALKGRADNNTHVVNNNGGTFLLTGSASITGNGEKAGGVRMSGGFFGMTDNASVSGNQSNGVDASGGIIIMGGSAVVSGNRNTGINITDNISLIMRGNASISEHSNGGITMSHRDGGGDIYMYDTSSVQNNSGVGIVVAWGTLAMSDNAAVANNNFRGVYIDNGTFTMKNNSQVTGNTLKGSSGVVGGGVYLDSGNLSMWDNSAVTENTAATDNPQADAIGGGVYVGYNSTLTMRDESSISSNTAENGGGVYIGTQYDMTDYGTFIMEGGSISNNTASAYGGGVRVSGGNFTMRNGTISGNRARRGGGVAYNFTMRNGVISGNTAELGGGVYLNGTLLRKNGGTISGNDDPANANTATNSGHALYDADAKNWRNASAGPDMNDDSYGFWLND